MPIRRILPPADLLALLQILTKIPSFTSSQLTPQFQALIYVMLNPRVFKQRITQNKPPTSDPLSIDLIQQSSRDEAAKCFLDKWYSLSI